MLKPLRAALVVVALAASSPSQHIIAQLSGLANPTSVIDFGANLFPNFTPITNQFAGITVSHARYYTNNYNNLCGGFLTNDFSGPPNTVTIQFAVPVTDLSFVYHQISTSAPSTIRAMLNGAPVTSFSGTWNQTQPNNYFGFTGILLDELQIDFVGDFNIDTLAMRQTASCELHNGSGINPVDFSCTTLPVLGTTWQGQIAMQPNSALSILGFGPAGLAPPTPLFGGELLLPGSPPPVAVFAAGSYSIQIPSSPSWIGTMLAMQGFRIDIINGAPTLVSVWTWMPPSPRSTAWCCTSDCEPANTARTEPHVRCRG